MPRRLSVKFDLDGRAPQPVPLRVERASIRSTTRQGQVAPRRATMRVGEIAEALGVSDDTARRYLRQGKIPVARKTPSGFVVYRAEFQKLIDGEAVSPRGDPSPLLLQTIHLLRQGYQDQADRLAALEEELARQREEGDGLKAD